VPGPAVVNAQVDAYNAAIARVATSTVPEVDSVNFRAWRGF
jgi:hypothetical protein